MNKLARDSLWSLERYAEARPAFRAEVMAHKRHRRVSLGPHATLLFEDFLTMKYQVQEMLRAERIFEPQEIQAELDAYNPLIPDGANWKATFMIEYEDVEERRLALARMAGVEHRVWVQAEGCERVMAVANEDMARSNDEKTAAVHFLRFDLGSKTIAALRQRAGLAMGIDHHELPYRIATEAQVRDALLQDLN